MSTSVDDVGSPRIFRFTMKLPKLLSHRFGSSRTRDNKGCHCHRGNVNILFLQALEKAVRERANACLTDAEREIVRVRLQGIAAARQQDCSRPSSAHNSSCGLNGHECATDSDGQVRVERIARLLGECRLARRGGVV